MMVSTTFTLLDERGASNWLKVSKRRLRHLRRTGHGPAWITLPTGEIRYRVEELDRWATTGGRVIHVYGEADVVALPGTGVRVRHVLPDGKYTPHVRGRSRDWRE